MESILSRDTNIIYNSQDYEIVSTILFSCSFIALVILKNADCFGMQYMITGLVSIFTLIGCIFLSRLFKLIYIRPDEYGRYSNSTPFIIYRILDILLLIGIGTVVSYIGILIYCYN